MPRVRLMNRTCLLLLPPGLASSGARSKPPRAEPMSLDPGVKVVHARPRTVVHPVGQPGVIGAYERTALYAKVSGFVQRWNGGHRRPGEGRHDVGRAELQRREPTATRHQIPWGHL